MNDCLKVERAIHEDMARFRLHDGREFFTVSVDEAIQAVTRQVDLFNAEASLSLLRRLSLCMIFLGERVLQSENRSEVARQAGITYPALRSFLSGSDVKSSTFRRIAKCRWPQVSIKKGRFYGAPFVQFTADSETALGCSSYIARAALAGELINDASSDLPGSILVVARVALSG